MDETDIIDIKMKCLQIASGINGGYSQIDPLGDIESTNTPVEKILSDAQKLFDFATGKI